MIALNKSRVIPKILFLLMAVSFGATGVQAAGPRAWSVDLRRYGYQEWSERTGRWDSSQLGLAVANNVVAVGVNNPQNRMLADVWEDRTKWEISLLIFDPATGKLNSKRGPWIGDRFFELFSTSQGNLLLLVRHFYGTAAETGETLYLLSPTGDELKKILLAPSILKSKPTWSTLLVSSSGRSVLLGQTLEDGVHYKMLDADTLAPQSEWTVKRGSDSPWIIALSDKELLGFAPSKGPKKNRAGGGDGNLYARSLGGSWNLVPAPLDISNHGFPMSEGPNQLAFLRDDTIVGVNVDRKASKVPILLLRTDGSKIPPPVIPKFESNTSLSGPVAVSRDGRYFAVGFTHRPWLSHMMLDVWQLDDTFQNDELELVVWASSSPTALEQVNLGSDVNVRSLSLALNDPLSAVFLEGSTLKAIPIQPRR
ncbi:MAG: hypothetical protein WA765_12070 [Candidatus Acidiferrum sp.]